MTASDAIRVLEIYAEGIATGNATFETEVPDWPIWDHGHVPECRFVAESAGHVVGWAALTKSTQRCCYSGVADSSVYVSATRQGQGIGAALMDALVKSSEEHGYWTLLAGVLKENEASLKLHQKAGYRVIGINERLGRLDGVWRDVVRLERRSPNVGA